MNMRNTFRGALRRVVQLPSFSLREKGWGTLRSAGSAFLHEHWPERQNPPAALAAAGAEPARKTVPLPTIFTPGAPTLVRAGVMPKPTPANLRRFAEMPIARKAINTIKDRIAGMHGASSRGTGARSMSCPTRRRASPRCLNFEQPNPEDSFRSMIEQVLEDVLVGGFGAIELDLTGDPSGPW